MDRKEFIMKEQILINYTKTEQQDLLAIRVNGTPKTSDNVQVNAEFIAELKLLIEKHLK